MTNKWHKFLEKLQTLIKILSSEKAGSKMLNFATLLTNIVSIITYCSINDVLAKYQGIEHYVLWAKIALIIVVIITLLKIISNIYSIGFHYDENSCSIRYYSDEKEEQRAEGFHGVFWERLLYDSFGNLTKRIQLNPSGKPCPDNNGIHSYSYQYDNNMLCAEVYKDTAKKETPLIKMQDRLLANMQKTVKRTGTTPCSNLSLHFQPTISPK